MQAKGCRGVGRGTKRHEPRSPHSARVPWVLRLGTGGCKGQQDGQDCGECRSRSSLTLETLKGLRERGRKERRERREKEEERKEEDRLEGEKGGERRVNEKTVGSPSLH